MSEGLVIEVDTQPQGTVVRLKGQAGVGGTAVLDREFMRLGAARPKLVVLDCSELTLLASVAVGQLVGLQRGLGRHGGKLRLAAVQPDVLGSLQHSRLDSIFQCFATVADALAA